MINEGQILKELSQISTDKAYLSNMPAIGFDSINSLTKDIR